MGARDVLVVCEGAQRRVRLRPGTKNDTLLLLTRWAPLLERGPKSWLDREWNWADIANSDLAFDSESQWLVIADEAEEDAEKDLLGVLVTTGPIAAEEARLDTKVIGEEGLIWVEYIAIGPSLRPDCLSRDRRARTMKGIGVRLMCAAIERSRELGCEGRVGLHAEGAIAQQAYAKWDMLLLPEAPHRAGGSFPVFHGSAEWARRFEAGPEARKENAR